MGKKNDNINNRLNVEFFAARLAVEFLLCFFCKKLACRIQHIVYFATSFLLQIN